MNRIISVATVFLSLLLSACSTHLVPIKYEPSRAIVTPDKIAPVASVHATDNRNAGHDWVGAIRGGYGNPIKKLRTSEPIGDVVTAAFVEALRARRMLGTADSSNKAVEISIVKFDCSYYFNREAHAHLQVTVLSLPDHASLFSKLYVTDNTEPGVGAGIFGDVDHLARFAQMTLNQTIDKVLNDPFFHDALLSKASSL